MHTFIYAECHYAYCHSGWVSLRILSFMLNAVLHTFINAECHYVYCHLRWVSLCILLFMLSVVAAYSISYSYVPIEQVSQLMATPNLTYNQRWPPSHLASKIVEFQATPTHTITNKFSKFRNLLIFMRNIAINLLYVVVLLRKWWWYFRLNFNSQRHLC
jgi:hypothetical protein